MKRILFLLPILTLFTTGCSDMHVEDFKGTEPRFVLEEYFNGRTKAWGIVRDRFGTIKRQFTVDMVGRWDGAVLTLDEKFTYNDGEVDERVWSIRKLDDNRYEGTAADVVGKASGTAYGNALNWHYTLALEISGRVWDVKFDDWMLLQPDGVLFNRAEMSKLGIRLGEISLFFKKENDSGAASTGSASVAAAAE
jgi:hypothetical protein